MVAKSEIADTRPPRTRGVIYAAIIICMQYRPSTQISALANVLQLVSPLADINYVMRCVVIYDML